MHCQIIAEKHWKSRLRTHNVTLRKFGGGGVKGFKEMGGGRGEGDRGWGGGGGAKAAADTATETVEAKAGVHYRQCV